MGANMSMTSPFELNFNDLLRQAAARGASDVHIEPFEDRLLVRARIDGLLTPLQELTDERYRERFLLQAKRACRFDMAKFAVPQDSRFQATDVAFDLRASLLPTLFGEKIVLRLLERNKRFSLAESTVPEDARACLRRMIEKWQGLVLVTGPTGSGKTTLLYSALAEIDRETNNVHTLEEPIEYTLEGVVQTQIQRGGLRFAEALSALMRQDPDCILVGEIRDQETAEAALHAASTGHLVLSTVHANSARESIERLVGLGVSRELVEANVLFASAQRLVPRNCPHCRVVDAEHVDVVRAAFGVEVVPYKAVGCDDCNGTGVNGRTLLFEYLCKESGMNQESKTLVQHGSLRAHALDALKKGEIHAQSACAFE
jgi:type II secretory ATPase GspE/PulE/Tfp pilus assembly ATPase PilB-like protein